MAHYHVEVRGHPPIDWELLRRQRDQFTLLLATVEDLSSEDRRAVEGVRNLLDAMLDTHDDE